jgi:hypothetical protein
VSEVVLLESDDVRSAAGELVRGCTTERTHPDNGDLE